MSSPLRRRRRFEQPETGAGASIWLPHVARNEHREELEQHFGPFAREPADFPADVTCVFLCFINRSGSNYLAELLASGGQYNRGAEILSHPAVLAISKQRKVERFQDFFADIARCQQKSGRFFVKAALQHLDILGRAGVLDQIAHKSQYVLLERNDVLGQAISFSLAYVTRGFSSAAKGAAKPEDVAFSRETIDRYIKAIAQSRQQFAEFFGRNGLIPVRIVYECLIAEPEGEARRLARELGLRDFSVDMSNVRLERQAGPVSDEWRRRYLSGNA